MSIYRLRTEFGQHLKWVMLGIAVIFIVGAIFTFGAMPGGQNGQNVKGKSDVVATVNGLEITRGEFEGLWERASEEARSQGIRSPLQYADYRAMMFQQMVQSRLILSAAEEMGVDISDRKVNEEIDKEIVKALSANRESIMGSDLTKAEKKLDPRKDPDYKKALASVDRSIGQMEDAVRNQVPTENIRAKLAYDGIQKKIEQSIKTVTEQDVKNSYNVYKIRQIVLMKGQLPEDQLKTRTDKIMKEIRGGGDFAKLAKENGGPMGSGSAIDYSFDMRFMYPTEVREAIEKLKPGGVSSPVETDYGTFIVKLESVTPKMPAKMDEKTTTERRKQIAEDRKTSVLMAFQSKMQKNQKVKVNDKELLAYWQISEARQSFSDQAKAKKLMASAIDSLKNARTDRQDNRIITAKLAQMLYQDGKVKDGLDLLYPMLEGENATDEGADLRMLLGDMLMAQGAKEKPDAKATSVAKAMEQYKIAGEVARNDKNTHQQLLSKYQQLGKPELADAEQKWITDYDARVKAMQSEQQNNAPRSKSKK
ncbi:MAG: SurA N-terminal domain-containing protein [Armatimonadota bacterium]|nr:SurA N-terminal domain-containing protein [bacterium]